MLRTSLGLKHIEDIEALKKEMELVTGAGFDTVDLDLSMDGQLEMLHDPDCMKRAEEARRVLDGFGMKVYQGHAPFGMHKPGDPEFERRQREDVLRSISAAAVLGIEYLIVHPYTCWSPDDPLYTQHEKLLGINTRMYGELVERGGREGVKICTENMLGGNVPYTCSWPTVYSAAGDLNELMDAVPGLTCCLDAGHALVTGQDPAEMVREMGARVTALHLHNNNRQLDLHLSPFQSYPTDWMPFCRALKETGYSGSVNLEVGTFAAYCPEKMKAPSYAYLHAAAAALAEMIEEE